MKKGFLEGMGTALALFASEREPRFSLPSHSDEEAIRKDWQQAGNDIQKAAQILRHSDKQKHANEAFGAVIGCCV